jgi:hypothetical protein
MRKKRRPSYVRNVCKIITTHEKLEGYFHTGEYRRVEPGETYETVCALAGKMVVARVPENEPTTSTKEFILVREHPGRSVLSDMLEKFKPSKTNKHAPKRIRRNRSDGTEPVPIATTSGTRSVSSGTKTTGTAAVTEPKVKRGRGRPRKNETIT